ncbi:hypothetical protein [Pseudanabaena sp. Chao 1811]|uniref:hypothetical protein n=1 Tax=Pseudanabaena sp. Chao 1811 TaxID=2963092 RepID=UPI0022F3C3CB|nr:hypothetical protein [Pseudanabaena sp. Chao 1811]
MPAYKKIGALMGICIAFVIATLAIAFTVQDGELHCYRSTASLPSCVLVQTSMVYRKTINITSLKYAYEKVTKDKYTERYTVLLLTEHGEIPLSDQVSESTKQDVSRINQFIESSQLMFDLKEEHLHNARLLVFIYGFLGLIFGLLSRAAAQKMNR